MSRGNLPGMTDAFTPETHRNDNTQVNVGFQERVLSAGEHRSSTAAVAAGAGLLALANMVDYRVAIGIVIGAGGKHAVESFWRRSEGPDS